MITTAQRLELSEQEILRRESLEELHKSGIDPYPAEKYDLTHSSKDILDNFKDNEDFGEVSIAGRIMSRRIMGKASFTELMDGSGRIQLYINRDELCPGEDKELYNRVFKKLLDIGDFIGVTGKVFRTQMGEISIEIKTLKLLSKAIRPLPIVKEKNGVVYDSFSDPELRARQRYVDLVVNPGVKDVFIRRTKVFNSIRNFFNERGWLEVDTPVLQSIPGGASARPFATHHNTLNIPLYLRIANELYLKRLIVGGFDGVYEFSRNFRNEGMDRTHNPEFTCMEVYVAYKDYYWMMDMTEEMLERVAIETTGSTIITIANSQINFRRPFKRISITDAIKEHTDIDINGMEEIKLREICQNLAIEVDETMGKGKLIDEIFGEKCEHTYIQPTFITDYPKEMSPLCKKHRENSELTERFELMINGKEIANAYTELNDPIDQLERFQEQHKLQEKGDDEAMYIDYDFVRSLEFGMPPASGMGIGIDRLVMLLTGCDSIQDVLLFPQMRPEKIAQKDAVSKYMELGIPEEWIPIIQKAGYRTVDSLKEVKTGKLHQEICDINKKYKLKMTNPKLEEVEDWLFAI